MQLSDSFLKSVRFGVTDIDIKNVNYNNIIWKEL